MTYYTAADILNSERRGNAREGRKILAELEAAQREFERELKKTQELVAWASKELKQV